MIGQSKLQNRISTYTINTFPKSIILEGELGCGKHLLMSIISEKLGISVKDISLSISMDLLFNIYNSSTSHIYIIDIDKASNNKKLISLQNAILKFIEEPPLYAWVGILCTNRNQLLPTIRNRCQIFPFEKYTEQELLQFASDNLISITSTELVIYNTPGKILSFAQGNDLIVLEQLINNIIDNIYKANIPNILTIVDKVDFGQGGYDLDIFLSVMRKVLVDKLLITEDFIKLKQYYTFTSKLMYDLTLLNVNKKQLFTNYLLELKTVK